MEIHKIEKFYIIGLSVRTSNANGEAARDIPALWQKFIQEDIPRNIPARTDDLVYCIYTDYDNDYTQPYTAILGCKVADLKIIPEGMTSRAIETADYVQFSAVGAVQEGSVYNEWVKIWNLNLPRAYNSDMEVYKNYDHSIENAVVDIFISVT
jgi:predicted transcriptional regulator YdeE